MINVYSYRGNVPALFILVLAIVGIWVRTAPVKSETQQTESEKYEHGACYYEKEQQNSTVKKIYLAKGEKLRFPSVTVHAGYSHGIEPITSPHQSDERPTCYTVWGRDDDVRQPYLYIFEWGF